MNGLRIKIPGTSLFVLTPEDFITKFIASGAETNVSPGTTKVVTIPGLDPSTDFVYINRMGAQYGSGTANFFPAVPVTAIIEAGKCTFTIGTGFSLNTGYYSWQIFRK